MPFPIGPDPVPRPKEQEFTRLGILKWIKRELGHQVVRVELTDDQLNDCVDDAIDEVAPWVLQREYVTLPTAQEIDLSAYDAYYVTQVHKAQPGSMDSTGIDVFDPYSYQSYSMLSTAKGLTYTRIESMLYNGLRQYTKDNISFRYIEPTLYLDIGIPASNAVTIEYSKHVRDVEDLKEELYQNFLKKFSLAFAHKILGNVRGKFEVSNTPMRLDGSTQDSKASSELDRLRQELKDTVDTHFMID